MRSTHSASSRRPGTIALLTCAALALGIQPAARSEDRPGFDTEEQELMYFWGTTFGEQIYNARIKDPEQIEWIIRGLQDRTARKSQEFGEEYPSLLNNYLVKHTQETAKAEAALGLAYVKDMASEPGAVTTRSGLVYRELTRGTGKKPTKKSKVRVHYTGTLRDGQVFDSSYQRGTPFQANLTAVIDCWSEGIPMMKTGGKARITCPPELAYGERDNPRIPGGSALTFEVELLEVLD